MGDVVLIVQANLVTLNMRFLEVDDMSLYNAIMIRAWFHE